MADAMRTAESTLPPIPGKGFEDRPELHNRCVSCGFLAKHAAPAKGSGSYFEVDASERLQGRVFSHIPSHQVGSLTTSPICFRGAYALGQEVVEELKLATVATDEEAAFRVLLKERRCEKWFVYAPGLSPQQHLGGLASQELEQRQYTFQREMEGARRDWELKMEAQRRRFDIGLAFVVALFAIAEVSATVVGIFL